MDFFNKWQPEHKGQIHKLISHRRDHTIMKTFAQRIKALRAEVEALKAVKSKSSIALKTVTKSVECSAVIRRAADTPLGPGPIIVRYMALIELVPTDQTTPFIFSYSQPSYAQRGERMSHCYTWMTASGNPAVLVDPGSAPSDDTLGALQDRTINMTVYITATADFTPNVSQIQYSARTS